MDFLLDPNIAYLFLLGGIMLGILALVTPGTGLLELGALFCLVLAGYAVFKLPINQWAFLLLVLSIVPFVYSIQKPKRDLYLGISIFLLIAGAALMFTTNGWVPVVNPILALMASGLVAVFLWIAVRKLMEVGNERPYHNLDGLVGQIGEARTEIHEEGSVQVAGELWSARSVNPIHTGSAVRVVKREGFFIVVEKVDKSNSE